MAVPLSAFLLPAFAVHTKTNTRPDAMRRPLKLQPNNSIHLSSRTLPLQRFSLFAKSGFQGASFLMLNPPQGTSTSGENNFHSDNCSPSEGLKMELKKVRDEFKMSENDCGSTRVQVAQLTFKIKYLASVLHKKDNHCRKGLHEMVQQRRKLLKYLRRTDRDSYWLVLSKLGLKDVPEYKVAKYESK